ncbi:P-loop containing nucleoside triphosphate hydrolase protein [Coprinopsis marcescibilis]|uniref:P-loop containing nucleoside triphosphate hydrolase protein n=1 Tax=Coprinopsis marcescibilis TaxID=230819 RepID=A0A5C3KIC3_COPMA|nr:P-loop containing nucleoside triphosphate hydrolase protein [Coprinopsis marcescibilis]
MDDEATTAALPSPKSTTTITTKRMPIATRAYQQEMLDESLRKNIIIALDTGSGKTHIAVLRIKHELEREKAKLCWFLAPTVALCQQQQAVIKTYIPVPVGIISGSHQPEQWKNATLWKSVLDTHRIIVSTPQVFLDGLRHGYINMGAQIGLLVFDEVHHAVNDHPYNRVMQEFYFPLPPRTSSVLYVRPLVLGLTASPIFGGGNVNKAFQTIEANMDASICTPRYHRRELAQYVHRPIFKYAPYTNEEQSFSTNLATLSAMIKTLDIEADPSVVSLRKQLSRASPNTQEYRRIDQQLTKAILKKDTFTHRGLRDFQRAAEDICRDLGAWASDWYVWTVVEKAKQASNPYNNIISSWKNTEKKYLLTILNKLVLSPVSYFEDDILSECSDRLRVLVQCLLTEKEEVEQLNTSFSGIIFVQRRDAVIALAELLNNHPIVKPNFNIGVLLGTSESAYRHSLMDVTRTITKQSQDSTIAEFKIGEKNLIIATSVAEEGLDIPACGAVIRWDPPLNMASWIQSRGRARRKRSTFTLMYSLEEDRHKNNVAKWKDLEEGMIDLYQDPSRLLPEDIIESDADEPDDFDAELRIEDTGAYLNPHSAVAHLAHFCSVISRAGGVENRPIYDIDPPDFIPGWHSVDPKPSPHNNPYGAYGPYNGPWESTVTLPRSLPIPVRQFRTEKKYLSKLAAHRHAAFKAYKALYELDLLNDHLLPFTAQVDPEEEEEVKAMLADIEKRAGTARVGLQLDPWEKDGGEGDAAEGVWYQSEMALSGTTAASPLLFFTKRPLPNIPMEEGPTLYRPDLPDVKVSVRICASSQRAIQPDHPILMKAREYTRMLFWCLNGSRMDWDNTEFAYLFLPKAHESPSVWDNRRAWLEKHRSGDTFRPDSAFAADGDTFMKKFGAVNDITIVRKNMQYGRAYSFVRWQHERLSEEDEAILKEVYGKREADLEIKYPLLVVKPFPARTNLIWPIPPPTAASADEKPPREHYFVPHLSGIGLYSPGESEYVFLIPSILRWLSIRLTVVSFRDTLLVDTPLSMIPPDLLANALLAPVSGEQINYQRLETLGDAYLKFIAGIQIFAEHPLWHEGYLTRKKDHAVSNVKLAKEDIARGVYRWIVRDRMLGKKWKPKYTLLAKEGECMPVSPSNAVAANPFPLVNGHSDAQMDGPAAPMDVEGPPSSGTNEVKDATNGQSVEIKGDKGKHGKKKAKAKKQVKDLSTKVLADVVEALMGAAYLFGGADMGYECTKFFDLGLKWEPLPTRLEQILARVPDESELQVPSEIADVEHMLGYTFKRKILLIEALTHASYREHINTISYERMEFIGDSILDMVVTDYLYHAPGKLYSPGHMHLRKSAVVNGHFLAFICLGLRRQRESVMPQLQPSNRDDESSRNPRFANLTFVEGTTTHEIYFWQCLLHSSQQVLNDQQNTFTRFENRKAEICEQLDSGTIFPWAALTRLQAPKFLSDIVESAIGAAYIDSSGDMDVIKGILRKIGILPMLERIVRDDVDILHPVSRLSMWAARNEKKIEYKFLKERGNVACVILVDDVEEVRETEKYRGNASQEEVKFVAAEKAIALFKLRDGGSGLGKKKKPKKKKSVQNSKGKGKEVDRASGASEK